MSRLSHLDLIKLVILILPIPVTAWFKAKVRGRTLARIAGSNPAGSTNICRECCVLSGRDLCDGPIPRPGESNRLRCV